MDFIKKGNVRIRKKKHHIPRRLRTSKKSPFVGTCPVFGRETNAKSSITELEKKINQVTRLEEENKRLRNALELGVICMERNWFEEIPAYVKSYLTIAKAAITNKPEVKNEDNTR